MKYFPTMSVEEVIHYASWGILEMDNPCEVITRVAKEAKEIDCKGFNEEYLDE